MDILWNVISWCAFNIFWTSNKISLSIYFGVTIYMKGASMISSFQSIHNMSQSINLYKLNGCCCVCLSVGYDIPTKFEHNSAHKKKPERCRALQPQFIIIQITILPHFFLPFIDLSTFVRLLTFCSAANLTQKSCSKCYVN